MFEALHPPTIIAFGALISILAVVFYALLYPVREKQAQFEKRLDNVIVLKLWQYSFMKKSSLSFFVF